MCGTGQRAGDPDLCNLFHRALTHDGVGSSFNGPDFEDRFDPAHPYLALKKERLDLRSRRHNLTAVYPDPIGAVKYIEFFVHA